MNSLIAAKMDMNLIATKMGWIVHVHVATYQKGWIIPGYDFER